MRTTTPIDAMLRLIFLAILFASVIPTSSAQDLVEVEIQEWEVPWEQSRPRDPYVSPDGMVWFVGQRSDYVASLDPTTGEFERIDLPEGAGPHNLIVSNDGVIWYAGNRAANIGRVDAQSGEIDLFDMPDPAARDPHTLVFDGQGNIWFTVQGGNMVGHFEPATGASRLAPVPTERSRPYGIVVAHDGRPWFTEFGSNKLAVVDPETMDVREYALPREEARPRRLAVTSDGAVWYVDYSQGYLGRLDPESGEVEEWAAPSGDASRPYAMAVDDQDRLWYVETGVDPNMLIGFDPAAESVFSATPIGSGAGAVRHMYFDPETRLIWFGTDANTIGSARVP